MDVIITPEPERLKDIVKLLLSLADHPSQVKAVSWPTTGFAVSEDLFNKFELAMAAEDNKPQLAEGGIITSTPVVLIGETPLPTVVPVRKKPGRPRKTNIAEAEEK